MVSDQLVNRVTVNAAEHDNLIESVTVFQSNRAEIKRRVNLDLKRGQNYIRIERLPSGMNKDSIRVDGTGTAVISDVVYHAPSHDRSRSATATITLRRKLEALQKERNIIRQQSDFLENYGRTLDSKSINIEGAHHFLDTFGPRQLAVAGRIQELDIQVDNAQEDLSEAERKDFEDSRGTWRGAAITVTVLAEVDGSAELMLTYVVSDASWAPLYDVRASVAKTPGGTSTIVLHYRASITQTTGENWSDVALTLSTASPHLGRSVPKLSSWRIGIPAPVARYPRRASPFGAPSPVYSPASPAYSPVSPVFSPISPHYLPNTTPYHAVGAASGAYAPPPPMAVRQALVASAGVLNTAFGIPGRSDIPSDEGSHKVVIAVLELQADLEWICVPREQESVFLTSVSPNESFKTLLGVDSALRVTYPIAKTLKRTAAQAGFSFMAKENRSISAQSQRITVRNARKAPVCVGILDHVPVSTDARLKVDIITPSGLDVDAAPISSSEGTNEDKVEERPWKKLRKDLRARWASIEAGGEGTIEWSCKIPPSDEVEIELAWEVSTPEGQK